MNNTLDVIFLGLEDARHARLVEALSHLGFSVRRCHDLADVYDRYSRRPSPLIMAGWRSWVPSSSQPKNRMTSAWQM